MGVSAREAVCVSAAIATEASAEHEAEALSVASRATSKFTAGSRRLDAKARSEGAINSARSKSKLAFRKNRNGLTL